ncbi:MAG: rubredoxin, partial [Panacagrimonas sp.]
AYFPTLWFKLMDPRVVAHHGGDLTKANVYPAKREALLKRWAAPVVEAVETVAPGEGNATIADDATRHQCPNCRYVYDESVGCPHEGYAPGTRWVALPLAWQCPECAVREKPDFVPLSP